MAIVLSRKGGGGGGSATLPSWWTVDSTPGAESVVLAGAVTIAPSAEENGDGAALKVTVAGPASDYSNGFEVENANGDSIVFVDAAGEFFINVRDSGASGLTIRNFAAGGGPLLNVMKNAGGSLLNITAENKIGFFDAVPVVQPPGVPVTAAGIHAALVSLGLITA